MFSVKIRYSFILFAVISILMIDYDIIFFALLCMFIHEASHMISAKIMGYKVTAFELSAQGLTIDLDEKPLEIKSIIVIISGPISNLVCSALYMILTQNVYSVFVTFNLSFGLFNLIPLKFLDGGRLLEELLELTLPSKIGARICTIVNTVLLFLVWCFSIYCFLFESTHSSSMFFCIFSLINLCIDDIF